MNKFHYLTVTDIEKNTNDAVIITLETPSDDFKYRAGQYLTFRHEFEGEELRRSYSICASEHAQKLCVAVKKVEGGAFSNFANDTLKIGDQLEVMRPEGKFTLGDIKDGSDLLMIAAGSGITPIISQIETILEASKESKITLIYGNKTPHSTMFRERLEELKSLYMYRFSLIHVLSASPQDIELFSGRITRERCRKIIKNWMGIEHIDAAFICGPEDMIHNVSDVLGQIGIDKSRIQYELFVSKKRKNGKAVSVTQTQKDVKLTVILDGTSHQFEMAHDQSVLDIARNNNLDVPFSCESGICSTCRCKILEGEGTMEVNHALEDYEIEQGYALSCQLVPRTNKLVISYDERH